MIKKHLQQAISQLVKRADQGSDSDFEKSFSNVAHAFLQDKAPTLLEYELGFQLLDRNEDNTRAVGVFAFKVGSQIMYAPQFFLNGDLKGYELLYLKNQDMFVPISEGWLNHIINKRPQALGEPHQQEPGDGMFKSPELSSLSRSPMKVAAAQAKVAHYAADFMPMLVDLASADVTAECNSLADVMGDTLSLDRLLKQADSQMLDKASKLMSEDSRVLSAVIKWHGLAKFSSAIKAAEWKDSATSNTLLGAVTHPHQNYLTKVAAAPMLDDDEDDVTVYDSRSGAPNGATTIELNIFYSTGMAVRDKRKPDDIAKVVNTQQEMTFTSPNVPGLYSVLTASGQLVDKIVLPNIRDMRSSSSPSEVFVIGQTAKTVCSDCRFKQQAIMVADTGADVQPGFDKWFKSLPAVKTLEAGEEYVFVSQSGQVTDRVRVSRNLGKDSDGLTTYAISMAGADSPLSSSAFGRDRGTSQAYPAHSETLIVGHDHSNSISFQGNKIFVPASARKLAFSNEGSEDDDKFMPGDARDAYRRLQRVTTPAKLTANRHDNQYSLDSDMNLKKPAVLQRLMINFELGEQDAREIIKEASKTPGKTVTKFIKKADRLKTANPYLFDAELPSTPEMPSQQTNTVKPVASMAAPKGSKEDHNHQRDEMERGLKTFDQIAATDGKTVSKLLRRESPSDTASETTGSTANNIDNSIENLIKTASPYLSDAPLPSTPAMPAGPGNVSRAGFNGPTNSSFETSQPVAGMASSNYPKDGYMYQHNEMERGLKNFVQSAATDGKRDVFDVGMLSSMLMVASDDRLIEQWVPDLVKGMDRIGRLLFLFYWHYDKFEDRFGAQDLPELEEFLRTSFDLLGKLILFLKNKNVQDSPTQGGFDVGLRGEI